MCETSSNEEARELAHARLAVAEAQKKAGDHEASWWSLFAACEALLSAVNSNSARLEAVDG